MNSPSLDLGNSIADAISQIRFAPNSNNLLISSWDSSLMLYDADEYKLRFKAQVEEFPLLDCCFQGESVVYSAGSNGNISRYDLLSGSFSTIGNHDNAAVCIEYSNETSQAITAGWDRKLICWDPRSANCSQCLINFSSDVVSLSVYGMNLFVATGTSVRIYDLRHLDGQVRAKDSDMDVRIRCVRSIPYAKGFAVGSVDGRVSLQFPSSNSEDMGYTFRCHPKSKKGIYHLVTVNCISFNPFVHGNFATGDNEGNVIVWDAKSRKRLLELPRYPNSVASLSYNHGGDLLAIASSFTCEEANEIEDPPRIFIQKLDESSIDPACAGSSSRTVGDIRL